MTEMLVNFDEPREKWMILETLRGLQGQHRIQWRKHRRRRTDRQLRYYWPCFVRTFGDYLRQAKPQFTDEMAHEILKRMYLEETILDENTGQAFTYVRSTTQLSTTEFNEYLDHCATTLVDLGLKIPEASMYHEKEHKFPEDQREGVLAAAQSGEGFFTKP